MNRENRDRGATIERTREAIREQEPEAAEKDTGGWLEENPDDVRVIAASERLTNNGREGARPGSWGQPAVATRIRNGTGSRRVGGYLCAALAAGVLSALPLAEFVREFSTTAASTLREET